MSSLPVECCELYMDESMALIPLIGEDVCLASVQSVESNPISSLIVSAAPFCNVGPIAHPPRRPPPFLSHAPSDFFVSTPSPRLPPPPPHAPSLQPPPALHAIRSPTLEPIQLCRPTEATGPFMDQLVEESIECYSNYCQIDQPAQQHFINNPQYSSYSTDLDLTLLEQELAPYQCPPACSDSPVEPIPFLDDLILSVRAEIEATKELDLSPSQSAVPSPAVSRKRSIDEDSSSQSETSDEDLPRPKRKPISLASLTREEAAARKREQNRMAALRYREKQRRSKKGEIREVDHLIARNEFLAAESIRLEKEVRALRASLYSQFGIPLPPSSTSS
ncbi:unnamed protein product, partial [Mesorhabditis spiculigera]